MLDSQFITTLLHVAQVKKSTEQKQVYTNLKQAISKNIFVTLITNLPKQKQQQLKEITHALPENKRIAASKEFVKKHLTDQQRKRIQHDVSIKVMTQFFQQLWKQCPQDKRSSFMQVIEKYTGKKLENLQ